MKKRQQSGLYGQAVEHYKRTHEVLLKYSSIPSFRSILRECDEIVATIRDRLRALIPSSVGAPDPKIHHTKSRELRALFHLNRRA